MGRHSAEEAAQPGATDPELLRGSVWRDGDIFARVLGHGRAYDTPYVDWEHIPYVDWERVTPDRRAVGDYPWVASEGATIRSTREAFLAEFSPYWDSPASDEIPHVPVGARLKTPPHRTDLTERFADYHQAQNAERVSFPWHNISYGPLATLAAVADDMVPHLRDAAEHNNPDITMREFIVAECGKVASEGGEFFEAFLRYLGVARRHGSHDEAMAELADSVISAFIAANLLDGNLATAIEDKLRVIYARGWTEEDE